jgi:hypothetical protein
MTKKPKKKIRYVRMYHDVVLKADGSIDQKRSRWDRVRFSDGKGRYEVPITMTGRFLDKTRRGSTYECVLAKGTDAWAKANPDLLPHDCEYVYVTRSAIYIVDEFKSGKPFHAFRYMHGFSQMTETFDTITKVQFKKRFEGHGFTLVLKPGRVYRGGESNEGGNGKGGTRAHTHMRGAKARAVAAGLIAPTVAA